MPGGAGVAVLAIAGGRVPVATVMGVGALTDVSTGAAVAVIRAGAVRPGTGDERAGGVEVFALPGRRRVAVGPVATVTEVGET